MSVGTKLNKQIPWDTRVIAVRYSADANGKREVVFKADGTVESHKMLHILFPVCPGQLWRRYGRLLGEDEDRDACVLPNSGPLELLAGDPPLYSGSRPEYRTQSIVHIEIWTWVEGAKHT